RLADKAILPTAWGGRYFFNRIGQKQSFALHVTTGNLREQLVSSRTVIGRAVRHRMQQPLMSQPDGV
ncbi:hypothetical protein ACSESK_31500, partial [Pseudomonas aeruginosa]